MSETRYICFQNNGEVPINAFKLLGASSKRNDSGKIGYFGTGLKYAIAVLLRENINFRIFSGTQEVKITITKTKFIDDTVNVMTVNGEKTSITIDAGIDWEPWFAIREIYSNAIDENGKMMVNQNVTPEVGTTKIYIDEEAPALQDIFKNWPAFFSANRAMVYRNTNGSILPKLNTVPEYTVFRKGIRAFSSRKPSIFDYDLQTLEINESRVAKYDFQVREHCSDLLASAPQEVIETYVQRSNHDKVEWGNDFWDYTGLSSFSEAWLAVLKDKLLVPADFAGSYDLTETCLVLPDKLISQLRKRFGKGITLAGEDNGRYTVLSKVDKDPLQKILDIYSTVGLHWELDKVDIVNFIDKDILGMADDGRVCLSARLFDMTYKHKVPAVLLEEIVHAKTGYSDCTRQMQGFLFDTITNMAREIHETKSSSVN